MIEIMNKTSQDRICDGIVIRGLVNEGDIGRRLLWARQQAGLTVRALGEQAKVSPSTVTELENGHHTPRTDVVARLARALNVDPCWLAYGTGETPEGWAGFKRLGGPTG